MTQRPSELANPRSDRVRAVSALGGRSARKKHGLILIEGPQAVREALRFSSEHLRDVYMSRSAQERHPELWDEALESTRWVHPVTDQVSQAMSDDAQGIVAVARREALFSSTWDSLLLGSTTTLVVLPRTQDPGNLGTIIRTADAFGAHAVLLAQGCVDVASPKVIRASAGSVFHMPILTGLDFEQIPSVLAERGVRMLGTAGGDHAETLDSAVVAGDLAGPHAWVFGNEAQGLSRGEMLACDRLVRVPMSGHAESLNVAVCAAVCLFVSQQHRVGLMSSMERGGSDAASE